MGWDELGSSDSSQLVILCAKVWISIDVDAYTSRKCCLFVGWLVGLG